MARWTREMKNALGKLSDARLASLFDVPISEVKAQRNIFKKELPAHSSYHFINVIDKNGKNSSISLKKEEYNELSKKLGGDEKLRAMSKQIALRYNSSTGYGRSSYVRKRLIAKASKI